LYLKEYFGEALEFPDENGRFDLQTYHDNHDFLVIGGAPSTINSEIPWRIPDTTSSSSTQSSSLVSRRQNPLATVKIVRADLSAQGKPINMHLHNRAIHVNIYNTDDASVHFVVNKVRDIMDDQTLLLVGTGGLVLNQEEGTTGMQYFNVSNK